MPTESHSNNQVASAESLKQSLRSVAKFKQRSFETSANSHIPFLKTCTGGPEVVLLGDSMIERMATTGESSGFQSWPSGSILSEKCIISLNDSLTNQSITRLSNVFNAGVGGDKYENILYRLVGDEFSKERQPLTGLLDMLKSCNVSLWVIHAGTNNLHPKKGLSDVDVDKLRLILQAVLQISRPGTKVLLTELFYRKDITHSLVDDANQKLETLTQSVNEELGSTTVLFSHRPREVLEDLHLDDHVHLNKEGYRLWMESLLPDILRALRKYSGDLKGHIQEVS